MKVEIAGSVASTLPADDDHPYRTGAWQPNFVEYDATDLDVIGEIPDDLNGIYLRNTENPVHPSIDRLYHPFDGDGMLHMIRFADGHAEYRNRFVRTAGFEAEQEAGHALWSGILGGPEQSLRADGWGARTRMKDASSTDVVVHAGRALTSFYQCGDLYGFDPTRSSSSVPSGGTARSRATGESRRTRRPIRTPARCSCSTTRRPRRSCTTASSTRTTSSCTGSTCRCPARASRTTWRSPRTTRSSTTARCSGTRSYLAKGAHVPRFRPDLPTRFAVIPRRGSTADIRWFEADPTYVLHWANAYEDGDEIVLDGFFQGAPMPPADGETDPYKRAFRGIDTHRMQTVLHALAHESRDRRVQGRDAVGPDHGIPDDQPAARGPPVPLHVQHDHRSPVGSCSTAWSRSTCRPARSSATRSATACSGARRRWRPGPAAPARTTATS